MAETTRQKPDYPLLTVVGMLVPLGVVMVYSSSFVDAFTNHGDQLYYTWRQFWAAVIGVVTMLVVQRIDYRMWQRYSLHLMAVTLFLLVLTLLLPASITEVNGARSWIRLGFFSMQPSEIAKLAMVVYFANWLSRRGGRLTNVTLGLVPFAVMLGIVCGLVMLGKDLGTTIVLVVIAVTVYFAAGASVLHLAGAAVLAGGAFWLMVTIAPYRQARIAAWLDPFEHYLGAGYQPVHALYALASGGLFGVGIGQGRQKFLWLPQAHTDTIFAIIGEEFGLVGTLFVVTCFLVIGYRGLKIAGRAPDPFAQLTALGLTAWLVFQAMINIAVVTSLLPFTGLTLPLVSYGGTSLVMTMVAVGLLLSISRYASSPASVEKSDDVLPTPRRIPPVAGALARWWRDRRPRVPGSVGRRGARESWGSLRRR
ncbi:MAG: hypothetical protein RLZZ387_2838 [Chloroflexota bacterium]|jgi:cell division protein FtsW